MKVKISDLKNFGIGDGISEIIATTKSADGTLNAAPIGIRRKGSGSAPWAEFFTESRTYENARETGKLAANITDDALVFVLSAFSNLDRKYYDTADGMPVLKCAKAWIIFSCNLKRINNVKVKGELLPLNGKINFSDIKPVNRGFNCVIEATVAATRYVIWKDKQLRELIDYYDKIVAKCGGKNEKEAMKRLYAFISG